jgi:hypothetical protein
MENVTPISSTRPAPTLDSVVKAMQEWRNNKSLHHKVSIPHSLWRDIFALSPSHSPTKVRRLLGISASQYTKKLAQLFPPNPKVNRQEPGLMEFCEVNSSPSAVKHTPRHEQMPHYIPVNTVIVEFCRADGKIMKIHATSHCFKEIIDAFYTGAADVTSHS